MVNKSIRILAFCLTIVIFISVIFGSLRAFGQNILPSRSLKIDNSMAGAANVQYNIGFEVSDPSEVVGSVKVTFCANSPLIADYCEPINGFSLQDSTLSSQSGPNDFDIYSASLNTPDTRTL